MPIGTQTGQPPTPPDVKQQQQGNPAQEFVKGAAQQAPQPVDAGKEYVLKGFAEIAKNAEKIAAVLSTDAPELMPIFVKGVTAFKMVEQMFQKQSQGQGQPVQGSEPQPEAEGSQTLSLA